jgi:hypothetical protein
MSTGREVRQRAYVIGSTFPRSKRARLILPEMSFFLPNQLASSATPAATMASTPSAAPALTLTFTSLLPYSNTHSIDLSRVLSDGDDTHRPATARNMTRNPVEDFLDLLAQHFNDNQDYLTALSKFLSHLLIKT